MGRKGLTTLLSCFLLGLLCSQWLASTSDHSKTIPRWCGKPYLPEDVNSDAADTTSYATHGPPGPARSFHCWAEMRPYYEHQSTGRVRIWFNRTTIREDMMLLSVRVAGHKVVSNAKIHPARTHYYDIDLRALQPDRRAQSLVCEVDTESSRIRIAASHDTIWFLPTHRLLEHALSLNQSNGLFQYKRGEDGLTRSILPFGYYTSWSGYLYRNLSALEDIAAAGYNMVHPVPGAGSMEDAWMDTEALLEFFDNAERLGLWVVYDTRHAYKDIPELRRQLLALRDKPALLTYYIADEPDGHGDHPGTLQEAYGAVRELDPYHPISLAMNCHCYRWKEYVQGADIVSADVYSIGIQPDFSIVYSTVCNSTVGCCGCDDCRGAISDIKDRITLWNARPFEPEIPKVIWATPQAFGAEAHWPRMPEARELVAQTLLSLQAAAKGIMYWIAPTEPSLEGATSVLSRQIAQLLPFLDHAPVLSTQGFWSCDCHQLDISVWTNMGCALIVIVNTSDEFLEAQRIFFPHNRVFDLDIMFANQNGRARVFHDFLEITHIGALGSIIIRLNFAYDDAFEPIEEWRMQMIDSSQQQI